ncbi:MULTISPECIES: SGNH/GDSL hydrolase family protein [Streptomyces]|uniref:G-D-S-L family lipolytic protein n=1 Tax=Streptomyces albus (strain ATCC 21838 / DSM 41398 / FERM P-419 / JCM 4703 / NBRC 107858) TaxID=1081613 RepID=A0A0B5ER67_STRA4|nr:SGNH/GDSL hydrolase family protein [Streptomyces sp. SCSIO ZS0520]AJE85303.1 G-D-S-L family lipolytic protein [Streptomyces albus]AOU79610.1 G-D-S-L family lipolytic protein [Streptomyces albus]AYN35333.1 GDSL family lipase [Streptomyces albus]
MTSTEMPSDHAQELQDPHLLTVEEITAQLQGAPWTRYAAIGDSIVAGQREPVEGYADLSWADRVAAGLRRINPELEYRNFGERDLPAAKIRATQLDPALEFAPDIAIVVAGGNDLLGKQFDTAAVETEQARIVSALRARGCTVVTMGLFDNTWTPFVAEKYKAVMKQRLQQFSDLTQSVTQRMGGLHVDLPNHPAGKEPIFASDGLHLNARGHAVVATEVIRTLGEHLAAKRA